MEGLGCCGTFRSEEAPRSPCSWLGRSFARACARAHRDSHRVRRRNAGGHTKQKKEKKAAPVRVFGRVMGVETLSSTDDRRNRPRPWVGLFSLESVRLGARYDQSDFKAVVELELRKAASLRNAYVESISEADSKPRAGSSSCRQSGIELTSLWDLPLEHRGLINDVIVGKMLVGGRGPGAQMSWSGKGLPLRPQLSAGAFQSGYFDALGRFHRPSAECRGRLRPDFAARAQVRPSRRWRPGVFGEVRTARRCRRVRRCDPGPPASMPRSSTRRAGASGRSSWRATTSTISMRRTGSRRCSSRAA